MLSRQRGRPTVSGLNPAGCCRCSSRYISRRPHTSSITARRALCAVLTASFPLFARALEIAGGGLVSNRVQLVVDYPSNFADRVDIYTTPDLDTSRWRVAASNLVTTGRADIAWETTVPTNRTAFYIIGNADLDSDADGLADAREKLVHQTQPGNPDSDGDSMPDGWEVRENLDPADPVDADGDLDGDGLSNLEEQRQGASASSPDSDNDGMPDGWEAVVFGGATNGVASGDEDSDGWNNLTEYVRGGSPLRPWRLDLENGGQLKVATPMRGRDQ